MLLVVHHLSLQLFVLFTASEKQTVIRKKIKIFHILYRCVILLAHLRRYSEIKLWFVGVLCSHYRSSPRRVKSCHFNPGVTKSLNSFSCSCQFDSVVTSMDVSVLTRSYDWNCMALEPSCFEAVLDDETSFIYSSAYK